MASLLEDIRAVLRIVAWVAGVTAYVFAVGWLFELVRFGAARLPALSTVGKLSFGDIVGYGVLSSLLTTAVAAISFGAAYLTARRKWDVYGPDWHAIALHGVRAAARKPEFKAARAQRKKDHADKVAERAGPFRRGLRRLGKRLTGPAIRGAQGLVAAGPQVIRKRFDRQLLPVEPKEPEEAPLGDWAVRTVAGFNILILSALLAVGGARIVGSLFPLRPWSGLADWLGVAVGLGLFLLVRFALTSVSPLAFPARLHGLLWGLVAVFILFASAPLGVLVLTGLGISTFGRPLAKVPRPRTVSTFVRSPVLWVLLGIVTLLGVAYSATPPVVLPAVTVTTPTGRLTGGFVAGGRSGVYVALCTGLADATSVGERVQFVPESTIQRIGLGGGYAYFDSGERPSLGRLALHALGLGANPPTLFSAALRTAKATCAGAGPSTVSIGVVDRSLGTGVIAGPPNEPTRANDGELPIQEDNHTPARIAALARKYQPTLLVTAADRNWPVSVNAVLAERGPNGEPACLVQASGRKTCPATASDLAATGSTRADYLQLPVGLGRDRSPEGQFQAFLKGQYQSSGPLRAWLADPGRLDPWYSAQIYFYYAGPIASSQWPAKALDPSVPAGLIGLEYWFYYPYNYYPLVVNSGLMDGAPLAGDRADNDLHQGDWEHVDVLLDAADKPVWLYTARHSYEGQFVPWTSPRLEFDGTHPVIQAAFGGHPSYVPGCGPGPRAATYDASADWLSCGPGRFAFRGGATPLVNIEGTPWACWPGYFGEATPLEVSNAKSGESIIDTVTHFLYVAGPRGPLQQAENSGVCKPKAQQPTPAAGYSSPTNKRIG